MLEVNKEYTYNFLGDFANKENFEIEDNGKFNVGESFIILRSNQRDLVVSFILTGCVGKDCMYKCVYSDFN